MGDYYMAEFCKTFVRPGLWFIVLQSWRTGEHRAAMREVVSSTPAGPTVRLFK